MFSDDAIFIVVQSIQNASTYEINKFAIKTIWIENHIANKLLDKLRSNLYIVNGCSGGFKLCMHVISAGFVLKTCCNEYVKNAKCIWSVKYDSLIILSPVLTFYDFS